MANGKVTYTWDSKNTCFTQGNYYQDLDGTVTYKETTLSYATIQPNKKGVYLAMPMTQKGTYPKKYKVTKATLTVPGVGMTNGKSEKFYLYKNSKAGASNRSLYASAYAYARNAQVTSIGTYTSTEDRAIKINLKTSIDFEGLTALYIATETKTIHFSVGGVVTLTVEYQDATTPAVVVSPPKPTPKGITVSTGVSVKAGAKGVSDESEVYVAFEGTDVSATINKYLLNMTYTDNEEDQTDDLQIRLQDTESNWLQKWLNDMVQKAMGVKSTTRSVKSITISDKHPEYYQNISRFLSGYDVMIAQWYLKIAGYYSGGISGKCDEATEAAIKKMNSERQEPATKRFQYSGGYDEYLRIMDNDYLRMLYMDSEREYRNSVKNQKTLDAKAWEYLIKKVNGKTTDAHTFVVKNSKIIYLTRDGKQTTRANAASNIPAGTEMTVVSRTGKAQMTVKYGQKQAKINDTSSSGIQPVKAINETQTVNTSTKKMTIKAAIKKKTAAGKIISLDCGEFQLDSIVASGPPAVIVIKGTSLPYGNGIRTEERSKSWENYKLSKIGAEIAKKGGLGFLYDCPSDPTFRRLEQANQTDLKFLSDQCHKQGYSLKVTGSKLVIFDQAQYEALKEVATVKWKDGSYTNWNLQTSEGEKHYTVCKVSYYHTGQKRLYESTAYAEDYDPNSDDNQTLTITNQRVESVQEAQNLAANMLRKHNKFETTGSITMLGNPALCAGCTIKLSGFGMWDGKHMISQCLHTVGNGGYTTKMTFRAIIAS